MSKFSWESFNKIPLIGIVRNLPAQQVIEMVEYYYSAGLRTIEVTMNSPGATDIIKALVEASAGKMNIGAGTVCTMEDLQNAVGAGAQFIVTPVLNESIIRESVKLSVPIFPGAYTPTEIYNAWSMGASMVKVFPATRLGVDFIKDVLAPMNYLKLVPTGGVDSNNFTDYLAAGAAGVGLGSNLFPRDLIEQRRWDELKKIFQTFYIRYSEFRNRSI